MIMTMTSEEQPAKPQPAFENTPAVQPAPKRETHLGRLATALTVVVALGGGALFWKHEHDARETLEAQTSLAIRLGDMGIKNIHNFTTNSQGQELVVVYTDPGEPDNQEITFQVIKQPKLELEDALVQQTTHHIVGREFYVDNFATEQTAIAGLEARN
jgi:hypothetical protein